jgi:cytochrome c biogenesis protein CcdA
MRCSIVFGILLLGLLAGIPLYAELTLSDDEWDVGAVDADKILTKAIIMENRGAQSIEARFILTCECFTILPERLTLGPGERRTVMLSFNPAEEQGDVEKLLIMESSDAPGRRTVITLHGTVSRPEKTTESAATASAPDANSGQNNSAPGKISDRDANAETAAPAAAGTSGTGPRQASVKGESTEAGALPLTLYYSFGCKTCERLLREFFPPLERRLGITFLIRKKNILRPEIMQEFSAVLAQHKVPMQEFPALIMGDTILQGEGEIRAQLERKVGYALDHPELLAEIQAEPAAGGRGLLPKLLFFPVLAAGLVDGINPCAFSTLIFLIVSLAYVGKNKRAIFYTGIFFTAAVFITYFLIGLGFFYVLRVTTLAPAISLIIKYALVVLLVVFAALSFYDFILIKRGRARDMKLQLPKSIKKRIHKSVRAYASSAALISGALVLGFLVSVFELACTGQIYFPVIAAVIQTESDLTAYLFLGLYNLGFIAPLAAVFGLVYAGVSSRRITTVFQERMGTVKISLAAVFLMLAGIMILF